MFAGHDVPQRRRWWEVAAPLLLACGAWGIVAAIHLFGVWIANLGLFSWVVYGLVWLVGIALTAVCVVALWMMRGPAWAVPTLVLSVLAATVIVAVDWTYSFVHGYYRLNRAGFAAVASLAHSGELGSDAYYGDLLPQDLRHLSINERAARIGPFGDPPHVLFLPAWTGTPDGAVGYAYLAEAPPGVTFDCFADPCRARWSLGGGWYWLDRS